MLEIEGLLEPFVKKPFFCNFGPHRQHRNDGDTNWLVYENQALLDRINDGIDGYLVAHLLNLIRYAESLSSTQKETWKQSVQSTSYIFNIVSLCVLLDNKVQVADSFVSPTSSLANCLASKDLKYCSAYFENPVNARVTVADVATICLFMDHQDYSILPGEAKVLGSLMTFLKGVIIFNLNKIVHDESHWSKPMVDQAIARCQEKIQAKSAEMRNIHLLDALQVLNLFSAYQFLQKASKSPDKPSAKACEEKEEIYFYLFKKHKSLLVQLVDVRLVKLFDDLSKKEKFKNKQQTEDVDDSPAKQKSVEQADIEVLSNMSVHNLGGPTSGKEDQEGLTVDERNYLNELQKRLQEVKDWQTSLKKKPLTSIKSLREDYKKIPITKNKLDNLVSVIKEPGEQQRLQEMIAHMVKGTEQLREEVVEAWTLWKGQMQSVLSSSGTDYQHFKDLTKLEDQLIRKINDLMAKYDYFRRDEPISIILDKLEIITNYVQLFKILSDEPTLRSKKVSSSGRAYQDRIDVLMRRLKSSNDEDRTEIYALPLYQEIQKKLNSDEVSLASSKGSKDRDKNRGKNDNTSRNKSASNRSISASIRKRNPEINLDDNLNRTAVNASTTSNERQSKGSKIVPETASSSDSSNEQLSKSFQVTTNDSTPGCPKLLEKARQNSKSLRKVPKPSPETSNFLQGRLPPVRLNLDLSKVAELSLYDIDCLLKRYLMGPLISSEAKFTEIKSSLVRLLSTPAGDLRTNLPATLTVVMHPGVTYAYFMLLQRVREQMLANRAEIKKAIKEAVLPAIAQELKKLAALASFFIYNAQRPGQTDK